MSSSPAAEALLSVRNVEVVYDNVSLAIKGISLDVPKGGLIALLGANGAGKSSTLRSISGLLQAVRGRVSRGEVLYKGQVINDVSPQDRVAEGIVQVLEGRRVFEQLSPDENLEAACPLRLSRAEVRRNLDRVYSYFPRLAQRRGTEAGYLSGGEQQMLAIGRALMTQPQLLMLDEPSLGLAPAIVDTMYDSFAALHKEGQTILLAEQSVDLALEAADHAYVLQVGKTVLEGPAKQMADNPDVQRIYLGME